MNPATLYDVCHEGGGMTGYEWDRDPKRLGFILARYKFVAKMLEGKDYVLEVGCADGFGSRVVRQHVGRMMAVDCDPKSIEEARRYMCPSWPIAFNVHDIMKDGSLAGSRFDAVFALDVLEHIHPTEEQLFLEMMRAQAPVCIIGSPSLESQPYASKLSIQGHVNCKTGPDFKASLQRHWQNMFVFGMNDEVLHTGFSPMCQYRFGVCC